MKKDTLACNKIIKKKKNTTPQLNILNILITIEHNEKGHLLRSNQLLEPRLKGNQKKEAILLELNICICYSTASCQQLTRLIATVQRETASQRNI